MYMYINLGITFKFSLYFPVYFERVWIHLGNYTVALKYINKYYILDFADKTLIRHRMMRRFHIG
jgi:hypothetical protein